MKKKMFKLPKSMFFTSRNLLNKMLKSSDGTIFCLDKNYTTFAVIKKNSFAKEG